MQKQYKISSWGLCSWDPAAKEHKTLQWYDEKPTSLVGYEDLDPHGYIQTMNPNPLCIFGHQINKEQLNLWMVKYWQYKKDSYSSKESQYFESYFMFFLLAILLLTSIR